MKTRLHVITIALAGSLGASTRPARAQTEGSWEQFAGDPSRPGARLAPEPVVTLTAWVRAADDAGNTITFSPSNVGVSDRRGANAVYALGRISPPGGPANQWRLWAFSRDDARTLWSRPVPSPVLDSTSAPTIDPRNRTVIVATGVQVSAFDVADGTPRWAATLPRSVVNASPVVTTDLAPANRLFVTDFDGYSTGAGLSCINVDPYDPVANPHQPGDVLWRAPIGGSSGNSPAYLPFADGGNSLVFVATVGEYGYEPGVLMAFDARAGSAPAPAWTATNPIAEGFFGPVSVVPPGTPGESPEILAASYAFTGGILSSNLLRVDARTGAVRSSIPANRTGACPIPLPGRRAALSAGVMGYGSVPSVELFDLDPGVMLWDSALAAWQDANSNSVLDPGEYTPLGGWSQQPAVLFWAGHAVMFTGTLGSASSGATSLTRIDLGLVPGELGFAAGVGTLPGNSPAIAGVNLYAAGSAGLVALGPTPTMLDCNADSAATVDDLYAWEAGVGRRDLDADGAADSGDEGVLIRSLRAPEFVRLTEGRR